MMARFETETRIGVINILNTVCMYICMYVYNKYICKGKAKKTHLLHSCVRMNAYNRNESTKQIGVKAEANKIR